MANKSQQRTDKRETFTKFSVQFRVLNDEVFSGLIPIILFAFRITMS